MIHTIQVGTCVSSLCWAPYGATSAEPEAKSQTYKDVSKNYLPKLPVLNKGYGATNCTKNAEDDVDDSKMLKNQEEFNMLVIGTANGRVLLYAYGVLLCADFEIQIADYIGNRSNRIVSAFLSSNFGVLTLVVECERCIGKCLYLQSYSTLLLQEKARELEIVALKYGQTASLLGYLSATVSAIKEAWEDILLEIDSKLVSYAQEKHRTSSGTVSDDFLELLIFGTPSDALEKFLLHDLTEKGLKKLGHSIDLCYCNIQKHVLKHLQSVTQALYFHFNDLRGMARWDDKFGPVGLSEAAVAEALQSTGAFLLKLVELLQVIDSSMRNFKAFFQWLYAVIFRLSDDTVPPEATRVTQQDMNFVAEFLKENFAVEWDEATRSSFSLERVGQYLKDEPLTFPLRDQSNLWQSFLQENPRVTESGLLVPHNPSRSLIQEHKQLEKAAAAAFDGPTDALGCQITKELQLILTAVPPGISTTVSYPASMREGIVHVLFVPELTTGEDIYVVRHLLSEQVLQVVRVVFNNFPNVARDEFRKYMVLDAQFYNQETLSILLSQEATGSDNSFPYLVQLSLKHLHSHFQTIPPKMSDYELLTELDLPAVDAAQFLDKMNFRRLENMRAASFAVSGARNVVCVLFQSRRRVRTFEMDVEEEEEDDDCDNDNSLRRDKDMTDLQDEDKENSF